MRGHTALQSWDISRGTLASEPRLPWKQSGYAVPTLPERLLWTTAEPRLQPALPQGQERARSHVGGSARPGHGWGVVGELYPSQLLTMESMSMSNGGYTLLALGVVFQSHWITGTRLGKVSFGNLVIHFSPLSMLGWNCYIED